MTLHFTSLGPSAYRYAQSPDGAWQESLSIELAIAGDGGIVFADGSPLDEHPGTLLIQPLHGAAPDAEATGNAIFWNEPGKDGAALSVPWFELHLRVAPSLYAVVLQTIGSRAVLGVEVEIPEVGDAPAQFEALYARGMSKVIEFKVLVSRDDVEARGLGLVGAGSGPGVAVFG